MKFRSLVKNGFKVTEVGLGCWQLGGDWRNQISEKIAFGIMDALNLHLYNGLSDLYREDVNKFIRGPY